MKKTFSIITPTVNSEKYIIETLECIKNQTILRDNHVMIEHIIVDGCSTDNTLNILNSYKKENDKENLIIKIISEKDDSMYEALSKGFRIAAGDFISYLNAGDLYDPGALSVVEEVFCKYQNIKWLTGMKSEINMESQVTRVRLPFRYSKRFIRKGLYGINLPFIQQESTFWRRELLDLIDYKELSSFKYCGDYYLWYLFSEYHQLYIVRALIGLFRKHQGQITENKQIYLAEMSFISKRNKFFYWPAIIIEKVLWAIASDYFCEVFNKQLVKYSNEENKWILNK